VTEFVDTNILVYATLDADERKADIATCIVVGGVVSSAEVLNEFVNVGRRKLHISWQQIVGALDVFAETIRVEPVTLATHRRAVHIASRYGLRIFDACIVAAAQEADCDTLWSEDLQHGQVFERVAVRNPFLDR
jgi:predicted nucleic acid-binding protein